MPRTTSAGVRGVMQASLLGAPSCTLTRGSRRCEVPFLAERPYQLLTYLAVRGDWTGRDQLAALFWPDKGNADARRNLRRILHEVRQLELGHALEVRGDLLRWAVASDVEAFESALTSERLQEAVDLVRGPLAAGIESSACGDFCAWLEFERNRIRERWRTAALRLSSDLPANEALRIAGRLLEADPFDEEAVGAKLRALGALQRAGEAKRVFRDFAERLAEALGVAPSATLCALAATLGDASETNAAMRPAAPPSRRILFGREHELQEALALLAESDTRLVTITGPGGIGKTALAREVVAQAGGRVSESPLWIDLDDLTSVEQVLVRMAVTLDLSLEPNAEPLASIARALTEGMRLVVFDNCEHLVDHPAAQRRPGGFAAMVTSLLDACPRLVILVTSRVRLLCERERLLPLSGLATSPQVPDEALATPAARLFCARAHAVLSSFDAESQREGIVRICRLTEGLPLALELAAAWVRLLPCDDIAAELSAGLDMLESRAGSKSVRAAFDRSWELAAPHEREVLARLSIFSGSFGYEAAHAVAGARWPSLANLVDASLLRSESSAPGGRFSVHPLLRECAREKLACRPEERKKARAAHADYFGRELLRCNGARDRKAALDAIENHIAEHLCAWAWAVEAHCAEHLSVAAVPLGRYFEQRGRLAEGVALFEQALQSLDTQHPSNLPALAACGAAHASLLDIRGLYVDAETMARRALGWSRAGGQPRLRAQCMKVIGHALAEQGRNPESRRYLAAVLKLARSESDDATVAALMQLAACDQMLGNYAAAEAACREVLAFRRASAEPFELVLALQRLGDLLRSRDQFGAALPFFEEGLALAEANRFERQRAVLLLELGLTHCELDHSAVARSHTERALAAAREQGLTKIELIALEVLARLATGDGDTNASRRWLATAMRIEQATSNLPMQLQTASIYAEALAAEGERKRTAAIWTYVAAHTKADDQDRRRAAEMLAGLRLDQAFIEEAKREAARIDHASLVNEILRAGGSTLPTRAPSSRDASAARPGAR